MAGLQHLGDAFGAFPVSTSVTSMPEIGEALRALPEMQRLQTALRDTPFLIVGGAVRDILRKPTEIPKDIDCQVGLPSKDDILNLVKNDYDESEIHVQPMAVTVGKATDSLDGIDLLPPQPMNFDPAYAENDVNSLMFDIQAGLLIDPFGTGLENVRASKFRIVDADMEAWYSYKMPGRANNGKAPRALKMLHAGFAFADSHQQAAFVACLKAHLPSDLTEKVIAGKFSAWAMVLGMNIRGDKFNFVTGEIQMGTDPLKKAKYEGCLAALSQLDQIMGQSVLDYMAQVAELGACP